MKGKAVVVLLARLVAAAPLALAGLVAVAALSGHGHRWPDLLAQFVAPALVGAIGWTVIAGAMVLPRRAAAGVGVILLLLAGGAPQWFPPRGDPEPGAPVLRVYSANLWARNADVEAMIRSIRAADADVLVLIEMGDVAAARLDDVLRDHPYRTVTERIERPGGAARSVVASKRPLKALRPPSGDIHLVPARLETALGPVTVVGAHLTRPWPFQYQWGQLIQAGWLAEFRNRLDGPVIVAGDFNAVAAGRVGRQMRAEAGLIPARGWPGTWPASVPSGTAITIDQVWRSPDLAILERRLGLPTGSDHRPVITEFTRARSAP